MHKYSVYSLGTISGNVSHQWKCIDTDHVWLEVQTIQQKVSSEPWKMLNACTLTETGMLFTKQEFLFC